MKIVLVVLSFWVAAGAAFFAGSFLADYIAQHTARLHAGDQANAAAVIVPMYFFAKFIICPIFSFATGAFTAWKVSKLDLTF